MRHLRTAIIATIVGFFLGASAHAFEAYDATLFTGKPDLTKYGLPPITVIYEGSLNGLRLSTVRAVAKKYSTSRARIVLDIESLCVDIRSCSRQDVDRNVAKLKSVLAEWRRESPRTRLGFYGLLPLRDYWSPVTGDTREWEEANAYVGSRLAPYVDFVAPSLYTFVFSVTAPYSDPVGWVTYARANIAQARLYGKPVLPFIWMLYHANGRPITRDIPIEPEFWRSQLETIHAHADGVIIWGGWSDIQWRTLPWDPTAPWWIVTREFLG